MDRARLERPERHRDEEREAPRPQPPAEQLLQLQRTAGNAAVARAILARQADPADRARGVRQPAVAEGEVPAEHGRGQVRRPVRPRRGAADDRRQVQVLVRGRRPGRVGGRGGGRSGSAPLGAVRDHAVEGRLQAAGLEPLVGQAHLPLHARRVGGPARPRCGSASSRPRKRTRTTCSTSPRSRSWGTPARAGSSGRPRSTESPGQATLDSEDLVQYEGQTPAYHEAGHMLGLGDEYPGKKFKGKAPVALEARRGRVRQGRPARQGRPDHVARQRGRARARRHVPRRPAQRDAHEAVELHGEDARRGALRPVDGRCRSSRTRSRPKSPRWRSL